MLHRRGPVAARWDAVMEGRAVVAAVMVVGVVAVEGVEDQAEIAANVARGSLRGRLRRRR